MLSRSGRSLLQASSRSILRLPHTPRYSQVSRFRNTTQLSSSQIWPLNTKHALFSTATVRRQGNEELVAKFDAEIAIEEDVKKSDSIKDIKEYLQGIWDLQDEPGSQEVKLVRTYNDEHIEIILSVSPAPSLEQQEMSSAEDQAYEDEEFDEPELTTQSANAKRSAGQAHTADGATRGASEDKAAQTERPELSEEGSEYDEDGDQSPSYPVQMVIRITRDGKPGVLEIDADAASGYLEISNAAYWPSADLMSGSAEAEQRKTTLYGGPSFTTLDPDLQSLMLQFLEERGIDLEMILRLPDLVEWKEEKEYLKWLIDVKTFLS